MLTPLILPEDTSASWAVRSSQVRVTVRPSAKVRVTGSPGFTPAAVSLASMSGEAAKEDSVSALSHAPVGFLNSPFPSEALSPNGSEA